MLMPERCERGGVTRLLMCTCTPFDGRGERMQVMQAVCTACCAVYLANLL
jgi:hypothetical protein